MSQTDPSAATGPTDDARPDPRGTGNLAIYVNCFGPARTLDEPPFVPLHVGAALAKRDHGMVRDDAGDTISTRNPRYCEMTGIYWVWRNVDLPDHVGFLHYRRFFDFRPGREREVEEDGFVKEIRLTPKVVEEYGLDAGTIGGLLKDCDGLLPKPFDVRAHGYRSVRDQYRSFPQHIDAHLDLLAGIMERRGANDARALREVLDGPTFYANNMFVFSADLFRRYCEWIFPILDELDERIDLRGLDRQQRRAVGYLAERLMSVFVRAEELAGRTWRLREIDRLFVYDTTPLPDPVPAIAAERPVFTVVASTDANYVPHMGALMASVFEHADPGHLVHFVVLDGGTTPMQRRQLDRLKAMRAHAAITYVEMGDMFSALAAHTVFTRATFYRLILPDIMPSHSKVVFLDTDLVVADDPTVLMDVNVEGHAMAACEDLIMRSFINKGVRSLDTTGGVPAKDYLADYLGLGPSDVYRQVGVLVLNLDWLRDTKLCETMIEDLAEKPYWFLDQDVINMRLARHSVGLPDRWNVIHMDADHSGALDEEHEERYEATLKNPAVVHYAGPGKPWNNELNPFSYLYWSYLRGTPFYEGVLFRFLDMRYVPHKIARAQRRAARQPSAARQASRRLWRRLPKGAQTGLKPMVHWFNRNVWRSK